ncbi:PTS maltose transporter subunit IICB [Agarivorans sp. B2Z047]|uniref:PTS transporter subunit EIIC n=1 Tax=Agarivorans sp. B2Z047 TaxID=2652721 RepID=UPI00128BD856|nr:PTS transporter subunit EIIC [Agarivorans sp. B2Z047]MPW31979.1 PTS maltose transporter subunit IICB [Agarivorans sp. B2Z047]UQN41951.1 PTS transporter subunit EIIC [Agarivorans sp. B2Z047]
MKHLGSKLQDLGKALMTPISVIAAAGIFLGLAAALQNPNITGQSFNQLEAVQLILGFIRKIAGSLFDNLPLFFAVAAAIGLAKQEKPTAAFAAIIGFISMHVGVNYSLLAQGLTAETTSVAYLVSQGIDKTAAMMFAAEFGNTLGIFSYHMSVLGGVIAGLVTVALHNRFYTIVLPTAINFFGGRRFVPIITVLVLPLVGVSISLIWPTIGSAIAKIGEFIGQSGSFGTFLFAFSERLLIPTGLHHILNETIRFTPIGGIANVDGESVVGALSIFNYALTHPSSIDNEIVREATRFLAQGKIPVMMFALPGAALAMYHCARDEHKTRVKALVIAGALASFTTGITEPLEFSFIFVSPLLFIFHAIMTGLSFALMHVLGVMIGNMQGGVIDLFVFGVLGGAQTHWWFAVLLGACYFPIYYFVFRTVITRFNVATPGREQEETSSEAVGNTSEQAIRIIEGLGGSSNIQLVDNCFTRLRVKVNDISKVKDNSLKTTGASGVKSVSDVDVQVIYGPQVESIANNVKNALAI